AIENAISEFGKRMLQCFDKVIPDLPLAQGFVYKDPIARELMPELQGAADEADAYVNRWLMPTYAHAWRITGKILPSFQE
ncbi:MAG: hypothetical protein IT210_19095, partial [Armatimonadetes bacterium]|nr:hypothetical protein [Armatimonadota bacterium]